MLVTIHLSRPCVQPQKQSWVSPAANNQTNSEHVVFSCFISHWLWKLLWSCLFVVLVFCLGLTNLLKHVLLLSLTLTHLFAPPPKGSDGWQLYGYITQHFIATVSQDCKYLQTTIDFTVGNEAFSCTGKTLISAGKDGQLLEPASPYFAWA